jgi:hypothetical protein
LWGLKELRIGKVDPWEPTAEASENHITNLMESPKIDFSARYINELRTHNSLKAESGLTGLLICPYGHNGSVFQSFDQLLDHTKVEHAEEIFLNDEQTRFNLREAVIRSR